MQQKQLLLQCSYLHSCQNDLRLVVFAGRDRSSEDAQSAPFYSLFIV